MVATVCAPAKWPVSSRASIPAFVRSAYVRLCVNSERSVTSGQMVAWLEKTGTQAQTLRAKQILHGRVVYEVVFDTPAEADRFIKRFDS